MTLYAPIELPFTTPNVLWIKKCQQSKKFSRNLQKCSRGAPEIEHRAAWSDDPVLFLYLHQLPAPEPPNLRLFIQTRTSDCLYFHNQNPSSPPNFSVQGDSIYLPWKQSEPQIWGGVPRGRRNLRFLHSLKSPFSSIHKRQYFTLSESSLRWFPCSRSHH